ncbi:threonine/serine exporter family protein [Lachnospiraceae bacterium NSJ-143]|nr:threonine/serine exporter family protein [Lachnospiraceae bacterium NSJ-143]
MILDNIFTDFIFAGLSSFSFAILFNAPRKKIPHCAFCGGLSWVIYISLFHQTGVESLGVFIAALWVAAFSRVCSHRFDMPFTLFFVPSVIPLVPGSQMYNIMKGILQNDMYYAFSQTVKGFKFAGLIMASFIIIYLLPPWFFFFKHRRSNDEFK